MTFILINNSSLTYWCTLIKQTDIPKSSNSYTTGILNLGYISLLMHQLIYLKLRISVVHFYTLKNSDEQTLIIGVIGLMLIYFVFDLLMHVVWSLFVSSLLIYLVYSMLSAFDSLSIHLILKLSIDLLLL